MPPFINYHGPGANILEAKPKIDVVLSDDLLCHLRRVAQERQIPLRWLVAGLVCDTFETRLGQKITHQTAGR
jgi:hypothetical protein